MDLYGSDEDKSSSGSRPGSMVWIAETSYPQLALGGLPTIRGIWAVPKRGRGPKETPTYHSAYKDSQKGSLY